MDQLSLDDVIGATIRKCVPVAQSTPLQSAAKELLAELAANPKFDPIPKVSDWIEQLDRLLSAQLDEILHQPDFQRLESAWRGLWFLVDRTETSRLLKIRVLQCRKDELRDDLCGVEEFDLSACFRKIYIEEYEIFGGEPYSVLIGNYEFSHLPEDMRLLRKMAEVAASAHVPFLAAASPAMFNLNAYTEIGSIRSLDVCVADEEHRDWKAFRESEDSRFVGLCLPHILLRLPFGSRTIRTEGFNYEECVDGLDHSNYLWGNAAWALASCITRSFAEHGWLACIRGVEGGGLVEGLPAHTFATGDGEVALKCPTEVSLDDMQDKVLCDLGFIPLVHCRGRDFATFFAVPSCQQLKHYKDAKRNAETALVMQLHFLLCVGRFMQTMKVMARDSHGNFRDCESYGRWFNAWLQSYKHPNTELADQESRARRPLSDVFVEIEKVTGHPGQFRATAYLAPHFQLDSLGVAPRFVVTLPQPRG